MSVSAFITFYLYRYS